MAIEFNRKRVAFDNSRNISQILPVSETLRRPIRSVQCALQGFDVQFTNGDHPLRQLRIDIGDPEIVNRTGVSFDVRLGLRDASGTFDDPYGGSVDVLIIAEVD